VLDFLLEAEVKPEKKRSYRHWSRDDVVKEIRKLQMQGSQLNSGHIARVQPALAYAARRYIGSWEKAIQASGFDYSTIRRKSFWSKKKIVRRIKELKAEGKPLHVSAAEKQYCGLVGAATMYFGSWRKAIGAAGLDYNKIKRQKEWSKKVIVREIRRLHRQGMPLGSTIPVRSKCRILHAAAVRYYGSWAEAMRAARLDRLLRK
jgi:5,10-methylene-tetrahydrofolate dehydrogenase/methenyl tetrahydrofolate cyclohydrolase